MARILAGIVLYNPEIDRLMLEIDSIYNQVDAISFFDNGSSNWNEVKNAISKLNLRNIYYIRSDNNTGIGHASNEIFKKADDNGYDWVLMLDHDTVCPELMIEKYKELLKINNVGMFCPSVIDKSIAQNAWSGSTEIKYEFVDRCIQSGTLVNTAAWKLANGFDEWMFIDFVDFDFCMRLKKHGFQIVRNNTICIDHQLGNREPTKMAPLFNKIAETTHISFFKYFTYRNVFSPMRVYYCTRNNIAYIKKYADSINLKKERFDMLKRICKRILRSKYKLIIIEQTFLGIKDGIKYSIDERQ